MESASRLQAAPSWVRQTPAPRAVILAYHRVAELFCDPELLSVSPAYFEMQMRELKDKYDVITVSQLVTNIANDCLAPKTICITFDDGYLDNFEIAAEILDKLGLPASFFVVASFEENREFWWDELEQLLLTPGKLPAELVLEIESERMAISLGSYATFTDADFNTFAGWNSSILAEPTERHTAYKLLHQRLRKFSPDQREDVLRQLRYASGSSVPRIRDTHRRLSRAEILQFAQSSKFEIGAHTITHPVLSGLAEEAQRREIEGSKFNLEQATGLPVRSFAYPYGTQSDFSAETLSYVEDAGFTAACTTFPFVVWKGTNKLRLPRLLPGNCESNIFAVWLSQWFSD